MAKTIDYEFKRGDTKVLNKFRPTDKNGEILNLSNTDNIYFTMKKDENGKAILKKSINNGITLKDDGYYHMTLEASDTAKLNVGTYKYDIELVLNLETQFVQTIIEGEITLTQDITTEGDRL